jgi:hypothetical protein
MRGSKPGGGKMIATKKRFYRETLFPRLGAHVITTDADNGYESTVLGGRLDGWELVSSSEKEANRTHDDLCRLVGGDSEPAGDGKLFTIPRSMLDHFVSLP